MPNEGKAFMKGGAGCLVAFIVVGILVVIVGGSVRLDPVGVVFLLIIGGVIGLVVNWIYQKGRRDADDDEP